MVLMLLMIIVILISKLLRSICQRMTAKVGKYHNSKDHKFFRYQQGRRHEVLIGGGGRIHRHPNPPFPKNYFLLGFRPLYFENVAKCKNYTKKKRY